MGKTIRNIVIAGIILIIISYALIVIIVSKATDVVIKEKDKIESFVGKKYVYEKDTLQVVKFSVFEQTLTFSNGKSVSSKFLETQKEVK